MASDDGSQAIGMIEVMGLSRGLQLGNLAARSAAVTLQGVGYVHSGMVMVTVCGDVASVRAAVDAAVAGLRDASAVHAVSVLARPADDAAAVVAQRSQITATQRSFGGAGGIGGVRARGPARVAEHRQASAPPPAAVGSARRRKARSAPAHTPDPPSSDDAS